jgi:hypothetical protein
MVKDSFFAAANPELMEKMNEAQEAHTAMEAEISYTAEPEEETSEVPEIPEMVKHIAYQYLGEAFEDTTYSLVKSHFPVPSSTVPVESVKGTTLYGVVTTNSIDFYDREGCPVNVSVYDIPFTSFDLTKGGNMFASVVHSFGAKYFGITPDFAQYVVEDAPQQAPRVLEAEASPNFDVVGDTYADLENLDKAIVIEDDGTYRVVV